MVDWKRLAENILIIIRILRPKTAMGNLRPAGRMRLFKLFNVALLKPLKYCYFIEKFTKSVIKVYSLALNMYKTTLNVNP
jgi:hypothetical protein